MVLGLLAAAQAGVRFRDPGAWTADERAFLEDVTAAAPAPLHVRVVFIRGASPPDAAALAEPHLLAEPHGNTIRVAIDGLAEQTAAWGVGPDDRDAALRRAILHALVHVADHEAGWSRTPSWRGLSGWGRAWGPLGGRPAERDPAAFASPAARQDPAEDLARTATAVFDAVAHPPVDADADPRCHLASKTHFLDLALGGLPRRACPDLATVGLDPDAIETIELVYATGSLASVASFAGHVLVAVTYRSDGDTPARRDSYSLVAWTDGPITLPENVAGLFGGLPSVVVQMPLERVLQGYARGDDRDLRRYTLRLDGAQRARFLARLDELRQGWDRPYLFLTRNCTALPVALLDAALAQALPLPSPRTPEALLGYLDRRGLLVAVPAERTDELAIGGRALAGDRMRLALGRTIRDAHPELAEAVKAAERQRKTRRIEGYQALGATGSQDADTLVDLDRFLALSDIAERTRSDHHAAEGADPAIELIRAAKAAVRTRLYGMGVSVTRLGSPEPGLLAALAVPRDRMGSHAPQRVLSVWTRATFDAPGAAPTTWLGAGTALYSSRVGEPRRYSPGASTGYTLFENAWSLSTDGRLRGAGVLAAIDRLVPTRGPLAMGPYGRILVVDAWEPVTGAVDARWAEAGGRLAVWRGREGGALGWVSVGVAVDDRGDGASSPLDRAGAELPVALRLALGSPRQALTGMDLEAGWSPRLAASGAWSQRATGRVEGRLRIGEAGGVDIGAVVTGLVLHDGGTRAWAPTVQAGLRFERY